MRKILVRASGLFGASPLLAQLWHGFTLALIGPRQSCPALLLTPLAEQTTQPSWTEFWALAFRLSLVSFCLCAIWSFYLDRGLNLGPGSTAPKS